MPQKTDLKCPLCRKTGEQESADADQISCPGCGFSCRRMYWEKFAADLPEEISKATEDLLHVASKFDGSSDDRIDVMKRAHDIVDLMMGLHSSVLAAESIAAEPTPQEPPADLEEIASWCENRAKTCGPGISWEWARDRLNHVAWRLRSSSPQPSLEAGDVVADIRRLWKAGQIPVKAWEHIAPLLDSLSRVQVKQPPAAIAGVVEEMESLLAHPMQVKIEGNDVPVDTLVPAEWMPLVAQLRAALEQGSNCLKEDRACSAPNYCDYHRAAMEQGSRLPPSAAQRDKHIHGKWGPLLQRLADDAPAHEPADGDPDTMTIGDETRAIFRDEHGRLATRPIEPADGEPLPCPLCSTATTEHAPGWWSCPDAGCEMHDCSISLACLQSLPRRSDALGEVVRQLKGLQEIIEGDLEANILTREIGVLADKLAGSAPGKVTDPAIRCVHCHQQMAYNEGPRGTFDAEPCDCQDGSATTETDENSPRKGCPHWIGGPVRGRCGVEPHPDAARLANRMREAAVYSGDLRESLRTLAEEVRRLQPEPVHGADDDTGNYDYRQIPCRWCQQRGDVAVCLDCFEDERRPAEPHPDAACECGECEIGKPCAGRRLQPEPAKMPREVWVVRHRCGWTLLDECGYDSKELAENEIVRRNAIEDKQHEGGNAEGYCFGPSGWIAAPFPIFTSAAMKSAKVPAEPHPDAVRMAELEKSRYAANDVRILAATRGSSDKELWQAVQKIHEADSDPCQKPVQPEPAKVPGVVYVLDDTAIGMLYASRELAQDGDPSVEVFRVPVHGATEGESAKVPAEVYIGNTHPASKWVIGATREDIVGKVTNLWGPLPVIGSAERDCSECNRITDQVIAEYLDARDAARDELEAERKAHETTRQSYADAALAWKQRVIERTAERDAEREAREKAEARVEETRRKLEKMTVANRVLRDSRDAARAELEAKLTDCPSCESIEELKADGDALRDDKDVLMDAATVASEILAEAMDNVDGTGETIPCAHGRRDPTLCPHCLGLNSSETGPPEPPQPDRHVREYMANKDVSVADPAEAEQDEGVPPLLMAKATRFKVDPADFRGSVVSSLEDHDARLESLENTIQSMGKPMVRVSQEKVATETIRRFVDALPEWGPTGEAIKATWDAMTTVCQWVKDGEFETARRFLSSLNRFDALSHPGLR